MPVRVCTRTGVEWVVRDGVQIKRESIVNRITEADGSIQHAIGAGDCLAILDAEANTVAMVPVDAVAMVVVEDEPPPDAQPEPVVTVVTEVGSGQSSWAGVPSMYISPNVEPQAVYDAASAVGGRMLMPPGGYR